jgi:hypothetical protein
MIFTNKQTVTETVTCFGKRWEWKVCGYGILGQESQLRLKRKGKKATEKSYGLRYNLKSLDQYYPMLKHV